MMEAEYLRSTWLLFQVHEVFYFLWFNYAALSYLLCHVWLS